jgi:hypothetical protein
MAEERALIDGHLLEVSSDFSKATFWLEEQEEMRN